MKQSRSLKQRLIASVLVLVMVFSSLIGTTFAWFTDRAASEGNVIQTGTLKVDLLHKTGDNWISVKDNPDHKVFDYDNWEPGYTRVETLKVANLGNLALKYKLSVEALDGTAVTGANGENLADVIEVYITYSETNESSYSDITSSDKWVRKGTLTEVLKAPASFMAGNLFPSGQYVDGSYGAVTGVGNQIVKIALHMKEDAGNEYQKLSIGDVSVNIVATQWTYENDSFGSDYDKDSVFPELNIGGITVDVQTANGVVTNPATISGEGVSGIIPAGVAVDSGVSKLGLSVTEKAVSDANLTLNDGEALRSLDVHMYGVSKNNTVPMLITVEQAMKPGLNIGNYTLYHLENGVTVAMTAVNTAADLDAHNEFYYDPVTGDVTLAMATFSEVDFIAEKSAAWEGNFDYSWYTGAVAPVDEEGTIEYTIANADQLAAFGAIVGGMAEGIERDSFKGKIVKLVANINLGDANDASPNLFYPIGYYNDAKSYTKPTDGTKTAANVTSFQGTFDGQGNKISNFYQNTWQMWGNYDGNYYKAAMGLFGYVYGGTVKNLTVSNFSSDGEYTPTGVIAAFAAGNSTFENIAIFDCNPRVYNTGNGGIIGIAGDTSAANDDHITLKNITVDNSNKISALWGSYDVACGGLVGMYRGNVDGSGNATGDTIEFINCHVSAQIDVYNDVCGNYQYYAYRYAGMIIGSVRHNEKSDGKTIPAMAGISASGCTVNYGDWNDYYYCEFEKNGHPSYSGPTDYKFSRVPHSELNFTDSNGNGVVDANERATVTGCKHDHTENEDNQAIFLPFYQLFTGYSWGVSSIGLAEYSGIVTNLDITEGDQQESVTKFNGKVSTLVDYTTYKLGDLFAAVENCKVAIVDSGIAVSVVSADSANPVSANISYDKANWENGTITFTGAGTVSITIQDYFFCTPTTISVTVTEHEHKYDNACDTTCNVCGEEREITHTYDNDCDTTCNVCGAERSITHSYTTVVTPPTCTEKGYTTYTCACGDEYTDNEVAALGHDYNAVVTAPTCTTAGYTTYTCSICDDTYIANEVAAFGHSYSSDVTAPDCVNGGYTTYTCSTCGGTYTGDEVEALGHKYTAVATSSTCTTGGYVTYTCSVCNHSYIGGETPALGHKEETIEAVAPTCTATGLTAGKRCSVCHETLEAQKEIPANGHTAGADANCETAQTCTVCGVVLQGALGHSYNAVVTAPTCTVDGYTTHTCSNCNDSYITDKVTALGHDYKAVVTDPTCTEDGYTTYTCSVCKDTYVADKIEAKHSYQAEVTAPTCTATGYTTYTCSACGYSYNDNETEKTPHSYTETVKHPTCDEAGYTTYTCTCGDTYTGNEVAALGHAFVFESKFNGDFLYRVGNQNTVPLNALFEIKNYDNISVSISGGVTGTYSNREIQFAGTGLAIVVVTDTICNTPVTIELEVVDAVNATGAANATSNNVVLLNNCGFGSLEVSGGYTLYGNGFTMTCGSDSAALDMGYAFVTLNNGILDNVQIVCPNFDYAVLYKSNMTESGNRSETTDKTRYFNVKSGVMVSGNSQILNSRISGARAAVNVTGGNCLIDNSRLERGAVATLLIGSANSVTLRDVTLVQKPTASTYDSSKVLMGFSVLFICDANGDTAPVTLEGTLVQNAWVTESDKKYVPSAGQSIVSTALGKTDYLHDLDGDGKNESLNLGFAYMPESLTSKVNTATITDNRTNKNDIPYDYAEISILNGKTYVYSYINTNGTADSFKTESEYVPNKYGDNITVNYSDNKDGLEFGKSFGTSGWVYQLSVDLDKGAYTFDFSKLTVLKNGESLKINRSDKVSVEEGTTEYTLTLEDGSTLKFKLIGTATTKEAPQWSNDANGSSLSSSMNASWEAGLCVASSKGGTWSGAAPALQNVYIRYYSTEAKAYKVIHLADYTPNVTGKVNGSNTTCTITGTDFTLTLTGGQVHSSNKVYAIPVVCDGKLYFVAATSSGLVNSGNSARSVPVTYSFTDGFGNTITGSHSWSVSEDQNNEYSYSDFCSGKLTKLESSSGGGSNPCVTPDTLITLADGTQVRVDSLKGDELLLVWNMETGKLDYAPIMFIDSEAEAEFEVIKLYFSDGTEVKVIYEHGFWDYDLNKYVYLDASAADYIGHTFAKQNGDTLEKVQLVDVVIETELTSTWSPVTVGHLCYFVNGMLSMPGGVGGLFNIFEVDAETMTYDYEQIAKDIETYGLFTYEELNAICPLTEEMFNAAGGAYLKISIGKGNLTMEELIYMINRYSKYI